MTSNLQQFIVITKKISHYFSQFIHNYSFVIKEPVVLEKCIMAILPVYMKYQFKLYPFLSLYSTILYWQSGDSFGMIWNRLSDPTSLKLQWIQRAGNVDHCSTCYCYIIWCTMIWVAQINEHRSSSRSSKKNSGHF